MRARARGGMHRGTHGRGAGAAHALIWLFAASIPLALDLLRSRRLYGREPLIAGAADGRADGEAAAVVRAPARHCSIDGMAGAPPVDCAKAWIPRMNPGRVILSAIVFGSWQSTQLTGCAVPDAWSFALIS